MKESTNDQRPTTKDDGPPITGDRFHAALCRGRMGADKVWDIIVVGPCGSGKTTLVRALTVRGYRARVVAQEHSGIRDLWRHAGDPRVLVLLEAEQSTIARRRRDRFPAWLHAYQMQRLASARAHADLVISTDHASAEEVVQTVIRFLRSAGIMPHELAARP